VAHTWTSLRFLGATRTVTGSRFLVETPGSRVLVDCGLYQGERELRRRNWDRFPVPPAEVDAVVLSHAHLDHCGWLPRLVREGFRGPVYCSPGTAQVAPIVLRDAAHLQEEDADYAARHGHSRHQPALPLFDREDAERAIGLLHPIEPGRPHAVAGHEVVLRRAGHILGSTTVELRTEAGTVAFSGDLGRSDHPLLCPPQCAPRADALVVESTYGERLHPPRQVDLIGATLRRAFARGGVVLAPAFSIDRTPVLLMALRELMRSGQVPTVPVYVDSPMALAALEVYRSAVRHGDPDVRPEIGADGGDPFDPGILRLAHTVDESKLLNDPPRPCVIVSAAGMATGGRVVHHLAHLAPDPRNIILLPGFQVPGTRGHALLHGSGVLKMFGGYVPVRAEVVSVEGFSAHADAAGLVEWLRTSIVPPRTCYVVHGEEAPGRALAARISKELGWCAVVPRLGERVVL
jgi:metallo-beta-lactamase family protein